MQKVVADDLEVLLEVLPPDIRHELMQQQNLSELLEVVLDLGRLPEARFPQCELVLSDGEVNISDIEYVVSRIGEFSGDNRAGIERTLHRISAMRNREGKIVGLTCRVGRAVFGTVKIIYDLVESGKSVLLLGRPGIGKTTMLREVARVLADNLKKRVIVVDTSNEIAGDGDIPHPAIGHARRMQVPIPTMQHAIMIEAVENHMPEAVIIDEIGTSLEAEAARTIAERGVQLVGTAHGNSLENLMMNPTLSDLIGGIQTVTLGDEEARRRRTQKSILERKAPPTFDIVVEIQERDKVIVHQDVSIAVDGILRAKSQKVEVRWINSEGEVVIGETVSSHSLNAAETEIKRDKKQVYLFGVNKPKLEEAAKEKKIPLKITGDLNNASVLITTKHYYRRKPQKIRDAEASGIPIYAVKGSKVAHLKQCLDDIYGTSGIPSPDSEEIDTQIQPEEDFVPADPNSPNAYIRKLQHILAGRNVSGPKNRSRRPQKSARSYKR